MKLNHVLFIAFVLVLVVGFIPSAYAVVDYVSYDDPSIHLTFDTADINGKIMYDTATKSGLSNASFEELGTLGQAGAEAGTGESVLFADDYNDTLTILYLDEIDTDSYSWCMYIKPLVATSSANRLHYIINESGGGELTWTELDDFNPRRYFSGMCEDITCNGGFDREYNVSSFTTGAEQWAFQCVVYNTTDILLYTDGVLEPVIAINDWSPYNHVKWGWSELGISLAGYNVLNGNPTNLPADSYSGLMDEYYFYEGALDQSNITALYNNLPLTEVNPFDITECKQITASGNYTLTQNISGVSTNSACLDVVASGVTIDAGEYEVVGTSLHALRSSSSNTLVNDGVFRGSNQQGVIRIETGGNSFTMNRSVVIASLGSNVNAVRSLNSVISNLVFDSVSITATSVSSSGMFLYRVNGFTLINSEIISQQDGVELFFNGYINNAVINNNYIQSSDKPLEFGTTGSNNYVYNNTIKSNGGIVSTNPVYLNLSGVGNT